MSPAPKYSLEEQEALILDAAADAISESSLLDFTMSTISKRAGLSMGSIYKHMQSKDDVLIALSVANSEHMKNVFQNILALPLTTPQRMFALQLTSPEKTSRYSFAPQLDSLVNNAHVQQRASANWLQRMQMTEMGIEKLFTDFLNTAWQEGELRDDEYSKDEVLGQLNLSSWSLCVGFVQVALQLRNRDTENAGPFPLAADHPIVQSGKRMINSYQWQQALQNDDFERVCAYLDQAGYR